MSILDNRYFTRDCVACPFWSDGSCSMTQNCTTFLDLFSGGTFHSALNAASTVATGYEVPQYLQNGYYVDHDGFMIDPVPSDPLELARNLAQNTDIVGIFEPSSDK